MICHQSSAIGHRLWLCLLCHQNTEAEPDGRRGETGNNIAQKMHAEVDATESDQGNQDGKGRGGHLWWKSGEPKKEIRQKSIGHKRSHCVSAGKTPTGGDLPGIRKLGSNSLKDTFQKSVEFTRTNQGSSPAEQKRPSPEQGKPKRNHHTKKAKCPRIAEHRDSREETDQPERAMLVKKLGDLLIQRGQPTLFADFVGQIEKEATREENNA